MCIGRCVVRDDSLTRRGGSRSNEIAKRQRKSLYSNSEKLESHTISHDIIFGHDNLSII